MASGVIGLASKLPPMPSAEEEEGEAGGMGEMAAEDFIAASKKGDAAGVYSAFERMYRACKVDKGAAMTDESEDDEEAGY